MKVAVIGSRGLNVTDLGRYLPENTTEIVSGGAKGVDTSAREYALSHDIKLTLAITERGFTERAEANCSKIKLYPRKFRGIFYIFKKKY